MIIRSFIVAGLAILPAAAIAQVNAPQMPPQAGQPPPLPDVAPAPLPPLGGAVGGDTLEPETMPQTLPRPAMPGDPYQGTMRQPDQLPGNSLSNPVQKQEIEDQARQREREGEQKRE